MGVKFCVIFFFKQKTAYEMRISDWSSDVCSSDLKTRQRVRDLAEVFTHEREVKAMLDLIPDMFPAGSSTRAVDAKFLEPACGSGNFLEEILRRKLAGVRFARVRSVSRYEHWRSEEHTSELQSLMRISYAVF